MARTHCLCCSHGARRLLRLLRLACTAGRVRHRPVGTAAGAGHRLGWRASCHSRRICLRDSIRPMPRLRAWRGVTSGRFAAVLLDGFHAVHRVFSRDWHLYRRTRFKLTLAQPNAAQPGRSHDLGRHLVCLTLNHLYLQDHLPD